jgi:tetratricopeptide (TPR) repeat protein
MALISGEPFENLMPAADLLERFGHSQEAIEFLAARVRALPWDEDAGLKLGEAQRSVPALAAIMADPLNAYASRGAAARLLANLHAPAPADITGELALLARGRIDPAAAEQPLYFEARVTAAETTADPLLGARLLRDALAIQPDSDAARLAVFRAEFRAREYQLAVSALRPMEHTSIPEPVLLDLAAAYENLGELESARQTLHAAPPRADIQKRIGALDRRIEIAAQNALRRPMVTNNVAQERLVRPRLQP